MIGGTTMKVITTTYSLERFYKDFNKVIKQVLNGNREKAMVLPQLYFNIILVKYGECYKIAYGDESLRKLDFQLNKKQLLIVHCILCDNNDEMHNIIDRYRGRGRTMSEFIDDKVIEKIESEIEDDYSDDSLFNITSWGADLSFRELISMYEEGEMLKPELQRNYVWDKTEASRFIESILMGLPVPSIFLAQSGSNKLIVDGYQRIMTTYDYVRGIFSGDDKIFKLSNSLKINPRWRGKAFKELTPDEQRKVRSTTIHAIIFEQKHPKDGDTSLYQVFERINTSGRTLTAQEIRNCVYQGSINTMLFELNKYEKWRKLFGSNKIDSRMRDMEFILRFFVIKSPKVLNSDAVQISLKKELNEFMDRHKRDSIGEINKFKKEFISTIDSIYEKLGENAFRSYTNNKFITRFHPTIFDAVTVSFYKALKEGKQINQISQSQHTELLKNEEFKSVTTIRTTDVENINRRIELASEYLIG